MTRERAGLSNAVRRMETQQVWLVVNPASGSNEAEAVEDLRRMLGEAGLAIARETAFPDDPAPTPEDLERADIGLVAIYTGDGTINAVVTGLYGWSGAVLVLPGGTKNLFSNRLHGEREAERIIADVAAGRARRVRPAVARSSAGDALAELLAGPGTRWGEVREALRSLDVLETAESAGEALAETTSGAPVSCTRPRIGQAEGYPLLAIDPQEEGLHVAAYHAETPGEYLSQALALVLRNFREGPHDDLGAVPELVIAAGDGSPVALLVDGEQAEGAASEHVTLARCGVDLLATAHAE